MLKFAKQPTKLRRSQKLLTHIKREIVCKAVKGEQSACTTINGIKVIVHVRTVQHVLLNSPLVRYVKRLQGLSITEMHRNNQVNCVKEKRKRNNVVWEKAFFTDEKRLNWDGSDGLQFYWHDFRNKVKMFSKRMLGERLVMV